MSAVSEQKRKLIDIRMPVFETLSEEAQRTNVSLKKFIESLLEMKAEEIRQNEISVTPPSDLLRKLIGSARTEPCTPEELEEERLKYLLAK
jgi:macrodomain Ter protein organizer (MatP/YcbG family)